MKPFSVLLQALLVNSVAVTASAIESSAKHAIRQTSSDPYCGAQIDPTTSQNVQSAYMRVTIPTVKAGYGSGPQWSAYLWPGVSGNNATGGSGTLFQAGFHFTYNSSGQAVYELFYEAFPAGAVFLPHTGNTSVSPGQDWTVQVSLNSATSGTVLWINNSKNTTYVQQVTWPSSRSIAVVNMAWFDLEQVSGQYLPSYGNLSFYGYATTKAGGVLYPGAAGGSPTNYQGVTLNGHNYCQGALVNTQGTVAINYKP